MSSPASLRPVRGSASQITDLLRDWESAADPPPLAVETSGSTGEPKRVLLSRAAMRASADATHQRLGGPGQWLLRLPPGYVAGLQVLFRSIRVGVEPVTEPDALTASRRYASVVPTQLVRSLEGGAEDLRDLDAVLVGGGRLEPRLRERAVAAGLPVVETYGASETCGGCVYDGRPLPGVRVGTDDRGRVRLAGPVLFDGYDGQPEATADALVDGWFRTADLGRVDDDGTLVVLGRADDVLVSGGLNVPATAVAERLRQHPGVREAEVVGVTDPEWGQLVVAVLAWRGTGVGTGDLRDWVAEVHPRAWAPRRVVAVERVPLLETGKVDRLAVRALAGGAS